MQILVKFYPDKPKMMKRSKPYAFVETFVELKGFVSMKNYAI